jgi:hypothetical protein
VAGVDFADSASDWRRRCKTLVELDRNEAAREQGYTVQLFKLVPEEACPKNDIIVGTCEN